MKKPKVVSDFQTRSERGPHRLYGEVGGAIVKGLVVLQTQCLALREEVEHLSE